MRSFARGVASVSSLSWLAAVLALGAASVLACGGGSSSSTTSGFTVDSGADATGSGHTGAVEDAGAPGDTGNDADVPTLGLGSDASTDAGPPPDAGSNAVVYAHSDSTLYELDPNTNAITVVGAFTGCSSVIDIALDADSHAYVTTFSGFYSLDLTTAACTLIAAGTYPNSLSFVPKGTLDPNVEALVGYNGAQYVRIDTGTGAVTNVGTLSGGYQSSGDIVSVIGGGTFLTVNGNGCGDCLLQVDPTTGDLVQNYGAVGYADVWGLAFWAGTAYGFDEAGDVFSINVTAGAVVSKPIPVPNAPAGLSFYGAGSTTSAPPTAPDGGGIPIIPPK
jgi:hypothetical protein